MGEHGTAVDHVDGEPRWLLGVDERRRRARQHADFVATYGTVEAARATVDTDVLRELRDRKGPVEAVRALRSAHPGVPLDEAAQIIKSL